MAFEGREDTIRSGRPQTWRGLVPAGNAAGEAETAARAPKPGRTPDTLVSSR
jgi:hypothetical protein